MWGAGEREAWWAQCWGEAAAERWGESGGGGGRRGQGRQVRDELGPVYVKFRLVTSPQGPAVREGCGPGLHPVEEGPAPQGRVVPMPCWGVQGLDRAGLNSSVLKPIHGPAPSPALGLGEGGHLRSPGEDPHPQQGRVGEHGCADGQA